jgi:thiol-disulfide isomerase/thioredoxin
MALLTAKKQHIPPLDGATGWLNSEPLTPEALRGRVVLVQFWTYTCINWLRTLPQVRAWAETYKDAGLIVLGVHTPEFEFEHDLDSVKRAVASRAITYPVAIDNDYAVWSAFDNHYWPALYLIGADGAIHYEHFGEGQYAETERAIQQLVGKSSKPVNVTAKGAEVEADWDDLGSPETYLGYLRGQGFASGNAIFETPQSFAIPERLKLNSWGLSGIWALRRDRIELNSPDGRIAYRFHARDIHLVLAPTVYKQPVRFQVLIDGHPPGSAHGSDIAEDGTGSVDEGRLYQLIRQRGQIRDATFEIVFNDSGAAAFVFTFG